MTERDKTQEVKKYSAYGFLGGAGLTFLGAGGIGVFFMGISTMVFISAEAYKRFTSNKKT